MTDINRSLAENEKSSAYEYLCKLEEAKKWIEELIGEALPDLHEFEESLANGVYLCKLGMKLLPDHPQWKKVYDLDQTKYTFRGLDFRHTDNINFFIDCLPLLGLSKVFYPSISDIYERKNYFKLVYCLHALSHFLCKQGKVRNAVTSYNVHPQFSDDILRKATLTLRENNIASFETVESLVDEELQYAQIGIIQHETTEDEEIKVSLPAPPVVKRRSKKRGQEEQSNDTAKDSIMTSDTNGLEDSTNVESLGIFDDPKYVRVSEDGIVLPDEDEEDKDDSSSREESTPPTMFDMQTILKDLKCQGAGITVTLYSGFNEAKQANTDDLTNALTKINECLNNKESPSETLKALQNPNANLPYPYLEASEYYSALHFEKNNGIPCNVTAVYKGLKRSLCDTLLEKAKPGTYLLRQSTTLDNGEFVFSFRNQVGIKHWKLSINNEGKLSWGGTQSLFDSLGSFLKYFVSALGKVTKLFVYPGVAFMLKLNTSTLIADHMQILDDLRKACGTLSYGQISYVISDVNSRIRKERSLSSEKIKEGHPIVVGRKSKTLSPPQLTLNLFRDEDPWNSSMIMDVSRNMGDYFLNTEGKPGSFLVRPSENSPDSLALTFRTNREIRRWRLIHKRDKFYVYPRPNPYNSLEEIVQHFRDAVGMETGLVMTPLILSKEKLREPDLLTPTSPTMDRFEFRNFEINTIMYSDGKVPTRRHTHDERITSGSNSTMENNDNPRRHRSADSRFLFKDHDDVPPLPARLNRHDGIPKPSPSLSRLNPANITSWSVDDVCQWLCDTGMGQVMEVFRENEVDGECLLTLDHNLLKEDLKISQLGYRMKIMKRLEALKKAQYEGQQFSQ